MEYVFTLKYKLPADEQDVDAVTERLYDAGCDDALIGVGRPGRIALEFAREADSAEAAIQSAQANVQSAVSLAELIEVTPDLAGLTDVAGVASVSRQYMRKLMETNSGTFPAPVHEGKHSIWHLADVLEWLKTERNFELADDVVDIARAAQRINLSKEQGRLADRVSRGLEALFRATPPAKHVERTVPQRRSRFVMLLTTAGRPNEVSFSDKTGSYRTCVPVQFQAVGNVGGRTSITNQSGRAVSKRIMQTAFVGQSKSGSEPFTGAS